jgi:hypothetical protein
MRSFPVATKPKVDPGLLAANLLAQAGTGRQVLGRGQSGENNGLVGEIAIFTLSFDSLKVIYIPVAPQTNSNGRLICTAKASRAPRRAFYCSDIMGAADEPPETTRIELKAVLTFCF